MPADCGPEPAVICAGCGSTSRCWTPARVRARILVGPRNEPRAPNWLRPDYSGNGRLAQLVERLLYTQDVGGSSPSPPIYKLPGKPPVWLLPRHALGVVVGLWVPLVGTKRATNPKGGWF